MKFNQHYNLEGRHAFLSPSSYHWIRYDEEKMANRFITAEAARRGTELHEFASNAIRLKINLPKNKTTLSMFVNDVLGFRMASEQILYYSDNCFGTADALGFKKFRGDELNTLQIFDLKTGESKCSVDQLLVYAALFCLEYGVKPFEILYDLRIYQSDDVQHFVVDPVDVAQIMDKIKTFDRLIEDLKTEVSA